MKSAVTLYGYDRAGLLNYTVSPAGVQTIDDGQTLYVDGYRDHPNMPLPPQTSLTQMLPQHQKVTHYEYDAMGNPIRQTSPDAGTTTFLYGRDGRLLLSQNARQAPQNLYTYNLYDAQNRKTEVGQVQIIKNPQNFSLAVLNAYINDMRNVNYASSILHDDYQLFYSALTGMPRTEVTHTFYDEAPFATALAAAGGLSPQENLRSRVATVASYPQLSGLPGSGYGVALHYSYDLSGNVKTLTYDLPDLTSAHQRYKRIDYDYDLYSGKVTLVSYNRSGSDQFYQRYSYDDDNRLTLTETSPDGILWDRDAAYIYYPHGPLARVSLGDLRVQGLTLRIPCRAG